MSNADEYRFGYDPANSNSYPPRLGFARAIETVPRTNGTVSIGLVLQVCTPHNGVTGHVYVAGGSATGNSVDYSFADTNVTFVPGITNADVTMTMFVNSISNAPQAKKDVILRVDQISGGVSGAIPMHVVNIVEGIQDSNSNGIPDWLEGQDYYHMGTNAADSTASNEWTYLECYRRGANPNNPLIQDSNGVLKIQLMTPLRNRSQ